MFNLSMMTDSDNDDDDDLWYLHYVWDIVQKYFVTQLGDEKQNDYEVWSKSSYNFCLLEKLNIGSSTFTMLPST